MGAIGSVGANGPQGDAGPQGPQGPAGADGADGADGAAATIAVGTVTTGAAGSTASITNVGTSSAAIFDFTIPRGDTGSSGTITLNNITGAYLVYAADRGTTINCTANTFTVSLMAASTLGSGFHCWVWNTSNTSSHVITIDPNGAETIDGATTLLLRRGEGCQIVCDGSNWQTGGLKKYRLYSENAANNATRPVVSGSNACAFGNASQATATSSVAFGDGAIASGTSAVAIGTSRATTQDSVAIAITDSTTTYGAKVNPNTIAVGYLATASASYAIAIGAAAVGSGSNAVVLGGYLGVASSNYASAISAYLGAASEGGSSVIGGANLVSNVRGKVVTGTYATSLTGGVCQTGTTTLVRNSTNATPVILTSDDNAATALNQLVLLNNQSMAVTGRVIAQRKGSESTTSTAMWTFNAVIRRGANAASTALVAAVTPTLIAADADASAWTIAVTADTTNGTLAVTATGEAAKNIRWVCTLESTEVIYA